MGKNKSTLDAKRMFEQNEANEKFAWAANQPYIHWHRENAQRAAGGLSIAAIQANALNSAKVNAIERYNQTIYSGKTTPTELKKFDNQITDITQAAQETGQVAALLDNIVEQTTNFNGKGLTAHQVAAKVATVIGGVNSSGHQKVLDQINEILNILYDTDLHGLIVSLSSQKKLSTIKQSQLESLIHLEQVMTSGEWTRGTKKQVRNTLVDILTEQGLPDFIARCLEAAGYKADDVIKNALQFGKVRVAEGHQKGSQGKIDTQMTFMMPGGQETTQGISLKSNWAGYHAAILNTSIKSTLTYANQGNEYKMANAVSLFNTVDQLKVWMEWSNLDRALQGTMSALQNGLQDRADMLIEFTSRGLQIFNINYMLWKLLQRIKAMKDIPLSQMGFGMSEKYGMGMKVYDRDKFTSGNLEALIQQRSNYTSAWLSETHAVTLNAEAMMNALGPQTI